VTQDFERKDRDDVEPQDEIEFAPGLDFREGSRPEETQKRRRKRVRTVGRSSPGTPLGFPYAPVPRRVFQAMRADRLSTDDQALIGLLYERANLHDLREGRECVSLTLAQAAEGIGFKGKIGTLYKRIRRLHGKPEAWFRYRIVGPGRYAFTLLPHAPDLSEVGPRPQAHENRESTEDAEHPRPRSESDRPTQEAPGSGSSKPIQNPDPSEPVRDPQTFQSKTDLSVRERLKEKTLSHDEPSGDLHPPLASDSETPWISNTGAPIDKDQREREVLPQDQPPADPGEAAGVEGEDAPDQDAGSDAPYDAEADREARRIERKFGKDFRKGLPQEDEEEITL
jgi:hypothetical protein